MKHSDFKIGEKFYTGSGRWICTDIGTRVIVAKKDDPNADEEIVFDRYDFGGCDKKDRFHG